MEGCLLPKEAPLHSCTWHALMRQPIEHQVAAARAREAAVPEDARFGRVDQSAWAPGTRWCSGCQSLPPLFYFAPNTSQCRACSSAARHAASIRKEYDLSAEEYGALLLLQEGRCAICRNQPRSIRLAVDHDHVTGAVRGLLCSRDNHDLLGAGHDNVDRLRAAVAYLDNPPMSGQWTPPTVKSKRRTLSKNPADTDPSYLMFDHEPVTKPLPSVLDSVNRRMTVDQLILSGGRSDPESGVYWLAYRRADSEESPF